MDEIGNILLGEKNARQHADKKDPHRNERNNATLDVYLELVQVTTLEYRLGFHLIKSNETLLHLKSCPYLFQFGLRYAYQTTK